MKMGHLCRTKTIARFVPTTHMRYVPKVRPMLQLGALFSLTLFTHFTHAHTQHTSVMMMMMLLLLLLLPADEIPPPSSPFTPLPHFDPWEMSFAILSEYDNVPFVTFV